jgi:predicted pyridoxine 5'-phosphate oxidase superfamily flavin-nucleotide-binding protein
MPIPELARKLMQQGRTIPLATVRDDGVPNVVPMLQYWWYGEDKLVIGDLFMDATKKNIEQNGKVSLCVWNDAGDSFKFVGTAAYETSGPAYQMANDNLHKRKPDKNFKGVVVVTITEVYDATRGPTAGKLIAKL